MSTAGPDGMHAGWIEMARGPVFACYHPAVGERQRDLAILFCDPFGSDRMNLHLCYRALALELAASGFPVLRVDYLGTCDSGGAAREPDQVAGWLATLDGAADWLLRTSARGELGCFGALLGGTIAATFAASRSDVRSLALWGAHATGSSFLRELGAFQAMLRDAAGAPRPSDWQDGDREAIGFLLTRETAASIAALAIDTEKCQSVRAAAVFSRGRDWSEAPIVAAFEKARIPVTPPPETLVDIADFGDEQVRPPERLIEQLSGWWKETHPSTVEAAVAVDAPALSTRVVLRNRRGREVEEEWVRFGLDEGLVGIATRPVGAPCSRGVILVNGGANHRPGINRNYTDWARDWAEHGVVVLRMDIRGLGDSVAERPEHVARLYREETRADVEAAADLLAARYGVSHPVCGGLCAGGSQAFAAALRDSRIAALFMLNPLRVDPRVEGEPDARTDLESLPLAHYLRAMLRRASSGRMWSRDDDVTSIARALAGKLGRRLHARGRSLVARARGATPPPATSLAARFLSLSERGCRVLLVFDDSEPMRLRFEEALARDRARLAATGCFRLEVVHHAGHIFLSLASQDELREILERWLLELAPDPARGLDPLVS